MKRISTACVRQARLICARQTRSSSSRLLPAADASAIGVFGVEGLHSPRQFQAMAQEAKKACADLVHQVKTSTPSVHTLDRMDDVSDIACQVMDLAEICRSLHPEAAWVSAANDAFDDLGSYLDDLNTDTKIYTVLDRVPVENLSAEQKMMLTGLKRDMEAGGIRTGDEATLASLRELHAQAASLCFEFQRNILSSGTARIRSAWNLRAPGVKDRISFNPFTGTATVPTDQITLNEILSWTADPNVRKQAYEANEAAALPNAPVLQQLVETRSAYARAAGFASYAHHATSGNMAKRPSRVLELLDGLAAELRPAAEAEMERVGKAKAADGYGSRIEVWDMQYYMGRIKAEQCHLSSSAVAQYFTVPNCLKGLAILLDELFGCEFRPAKMDPSRESWLPLSDANLIQKFEIVEPGGDGHSRVIGEVHLDMFHRTNKYGAACFTTRCAKVQREGEALQTPRVLLSCSFPLSSAARTSRDARDAVLSHCEFETLLHEFGHAVHLLFSRTRYQHLAGFRGPLDFVEMPSHLFEFFAWEQKFLDRFAIHPSTGESIPAHVVDALRESKFMFRATEGLLQVMRAQVDQELFGPVAPGTHQRDAGALALDAFTRLLPVQPPPTANWPFRLQHATEYAGGYYAYICGQMLASQVWAKCFAGNPLNKEVGHKYRRCILAPGASREPAEMVTEMIGEELDPSYYFSAVAG